MLNIVVQKTWEIWGYVSHVDQGSSIPRHYAVSVGL